MGGKLLNRDDIVQWGLRLTDGCMSTYSTPTGLGPGGWSSKGTDGGQDPPANQKAFNAVHGFWITSPDYVTRPEVFQAISESNCACCKVLLHHPRASSTPGVRPVTRSIAPSQSMVTRRPLETSSRMSDMLL
jgi:hypothetical protein